MSDLLDKYLNTPKSTTSKLDEYLNDGKEKSNSLDQYLADRVPNQSTYSPAELARRNSGPGFVTSTTTVAPPQLPVQGLEVNKSGNDVIADQISHGVAHTVPMLVMTKIDEMITGKPGLYRAAQESSNNGYLSTAVQTLDPTFLGVAKVAKLGMLAGVGKVAPKAAELMSAPAKAFSEAMAESTFKSRLANYVKYRLFPFMIEGGAAVAGTDALKNSLEGQDFKEVLSKLPTDFVKGAAGAALLSPIMDRSWIGASAPKAKTVNDLSRMHEINNAFDQAVKQVKLLKNPTADDLLNLTIQNLKELGITPNPIESKSMSDILRRKMLVPQVQAQAIDKASKVTNISGLVESTINGQYVHNDLKLNLSQEAADIFNKARAIGLSNEDITKLMPYVRTKFDGTIYWNPNRYKDGSIVTKAYKGAAPTNEQFEQLARLRGRLNDIATKLPSGTRIAEGYWPSQSVHGESGATSSIVAKETTNKIAKPSFLERKYGTDAARETDGEKIYSRYLDSFSRWYAYKDVLNDGLRELSKLRLLGRTSDERYVVDYLRDNLNFQDRGSLFKAVSDDFKRTMSPVLENLIVKNKAPDSLISQAMSVAHKAFMTANISTNLAVWERHLPQPEFIAAAEIGLKNLEAGTAGLLKKGIRDLAKKNLSLMKMDNMVNELTLDKSSDSMTGILKMIHNGLGKLGDKTVGGLLNKTDSLQRMRIWAGAYQQAKKAQSLGDEVWLKIMSNLSPGQRIAVQTTFEKKGAEEAAQYYARIRARRAMFDYVKGNRPEFFRDGGSQLIPITSWHYNELSNALEHGVNGNFGTLARGVVYPMAFIYGLNKAGLNLSHLHPMSSATGAIMPNMNAQYAPLIDAANEFDPEAPLESLVKPLNAFNPARAITDFVKNQNEDPGLVRNLLKLKSINPDDALTNTLRSPLPSRR